MEYTGLYSFISYFILNSPFMVPANAAFTEAPSDVSVGEGEDVEMPCAFKAVSSMPMSLEIQWWYLKEDVSQEFPYSSVPANRAKVNPREATKISTVRVQGNAISHRLSLSKVKKEDEGVYECRVSDLWADDTQEFTVHAVLRVMPGEGMVAEEAVSHIQNRWPQRNSNSGAAGRTTSEPGLGLGGGPRLGKGKHAGSQQTQPGLLPSILSTSSSVVKSSASPLTGHTAMFGQREAGCSTVSALDLFIGVTLLFLHKLLPFLLAH